MLDVRIGGFEMAENVLHKHVNGILCVVQVIRNNDHAWPSDVSCLIQA